MIKEKKLTKEWQIFVPEIFLVVMNKGKKLPTNSISLENLMKNIAPKVEVDARCLLIDYWVVALTLLYGAQIRLNAKLEIDKSIKNTSLEKVFQQTTSHYNVTRILSNSESARRLQAIASIQYAINVDAFGNTEDERTVEGFNEALLGTYTDLITNKGSGSSKFSIKNPETRTEVIRAKVASLRSKWCSIPTYGTDKIISAGMSAKSIKPNEIINYIEKTNKLLVEQEYIAEEDIPNIETILETIQESKSDLNIVNEIDDSTYGSFGYIPIEKEIFNMDRNTKTENLSKEPIPDFIKELKSTNTSSKRKNK